MSGAYLPVRKEVRDAANEYLAAMAARGFVPPPMHEVVRHFEQTTPVVHPLDLGSVVIGLQEQPDGSVRIMP